MLLLLWGTEVLRGHRGRGRTNADAVDGLLLLLLLWVRGLLRLVVALRRLLLVAVHGLLRVVHGLLWRLRRWRCSVAH